MTSWNGQASRNLGCMWGAGPDGTHIRSRPALRRCGLCLLPGVHAWPVRPGTSQDKAIYSGDVPDQVEDAADQLQPHATVTAKDAAEQLEPHAAAAIVDIFVYVVVLNLFIEYVPQVISETFTLSLLTAVLLKGVLEIVVAAKNRVKRRFRAASTPIGKTAAGIMLWLVLFGSKFLVLEAVHLVFGHRVSLGGFFSVTLLILVLLLSRAAVRLLLRRPFRVSPRRVSG